jgi:hypothetical protein
LLLLDKRMLPFPVVGFYYLTCLPLGEHITTVLLIHDFFQAFGP